MCGIDVNLLQFLNVNERSLILVILANKFSGIDSNFLHLKNAIIKVLI